MRHPLRILVLACALASTPACAALHLGPQIANPISAAQTNDQRAYALIASYGALIETATTLVRDPGVPLEAKLALGRAEAAATPAVQTLEAAFAGYMRARFAFEAASHGDQSATTRAMNTLNAAAQALGNAVTAAEGPIKELQALVSTQRRGAVR